MNSYESPVIDIISLTVSDVISTSGVGDDPNEPGVGLPEVVFPRITTA